VAFAKPVDTTTVVVVAVASSNAVALDNVGKGAEVGVWKTIGVKFGVGSPRTVDAAVWRIPWFKFLACGISLPTTARPRKRSMFFITATARIVFSCGV
jgi:hypothetical protein